MHLGKSGKDWIEMSPTARRDHVNILLENLRYYLGRLVEAGAVAGDIEIDGGVFEEMVQCYYEDLARIPERSGPREPDQFKQKAFYAFWIRKLKPINLKGALSLPGTKKYWINEVIAIFMVLWELDINIQKQDSFSTMNSDFLNDLLCFFRYKSVSPHALCLVFRGLYLDLSSEPTMVATS